MQGRAREAEEKAKSLEAQLAEKDGLIKYVEEEVERVKGVWCIASAAMSDGLVTALYGAILCPDSDAPPLHINTHTHTQARTLQVSLKSVRRSYERSGTQRGQPQRLQARRATPLRRGSRRLWDGQMHLGGSWR